MAGYWIVRGSAIRDEAALQRYAEMWARIAPRFGAEVIVRGEADTREGPHSPRHLVVRFDSYRCAVECYEDPEYQQAMQLARRAYDRELVIIDAD